jgi:hypothetical protein
MQAHHWTLLSVREVARIASEAAQAASPALTVTGVTVTGGSGYSEILIFNRGCRTEPCRRTLGVFRNSSETALRAEIIDLLRRHLARDEKAHGLRAITRQTSDGAGAR